MNKQEIQASASAFLRNIAAAITALGVVAGASAYLLSPRAEHWVRSVVSDTVAELFTATGRNAETLGALGGQIDRAVIQIERLSGRLDAIERRSAVITGPLLQFTQRGHAISSARPGGVVHLSWTFRKIGACGIPVVSVMFRNGGGRIHRFQNVSILDPDGRGVEVSPDADALQVIEYTAVIPSNEGVEPGWAMGWVSVRYPDCPHIEQARSPEVPFQILEPDP